MKKIVLSIAGLLAATAFAPEASAVPVFARQTGMACSSCHFQHFPLLNAVGQDFKANGFTKMGAKGKFKSEDLSISDTVNMGVFTTTYFQSQSNNLAGTNPVDKWGVPGTGGELSLFIGGRISEFAGFLSEAGLGGGGTANTGGLVGAAKLVMLFPVGDARIGPVIYSSTGQGAAYSFELLNTGAAATHKMMGNGGPSDQHVQAAYAAQYLGTATAATGISVVANNAMGFINVGAWEMAGNDAVGGANNLDLTYIRLASTTNFGDWEAGFGIQNFGGKSFVTGPLLFTTQYNAPKATIIDGQMQGQLKEMPVGLYVSYGTAAAGTATETNPFNQTGTKAKTSLNLAAEFGIIPHVSTVQVALRLAKNGVDTGIANGAVASGTSQSDNALMLGVTYELAQNVSLSFNHTQQSGSAWNVDTGGKTANTLLLETLF